jgi:hypothetical protein
MPRDSTVSPESRGLVAPFLLRFLVVFQMWTLVLPPFMTWSV